MKFQLEAEICILSAGEGWGEAKNGSITDKNCRNSFEYAVNSFLSENHAKSLIKCSSYASGCSMVLEKVHIRQMVLLAEVQM